MLSNDVLYPLNHQRCRTGRSQQFQFWHSICNAVLRLIRITTRKEENNTLITIDGQATETDLAEIRRVRKGVKGAVDLNLRGLDVCSPAGIRLLRDWLSAGARLQAATPFLEMTLKDTAP